MTKANATIYSLAVLIAVHELCAQIQVEFFWPLNASWKRLKRVSSERHLRVNIEVNEQNESRKNNRLEI